MKIKYCQGLYFPKIFLYLAIPMIIFYGLLLDIEKNINLKSINLYIVLIIVLILILSKRKTELENNNFRVIFSFLNLIKIGKWLNIKNYKWILLKKSKNKITSKSVSGVYMNTVGLNLENVSTDIIIVKNKKKKLLLYSGDSKNANEIIMKLAKINSDLIFFNGAIKKGREMRVV